MTLLTVASKPHSTVPDDTFFAPASPLSRPPSSSVMAHPQSVKQVSITHTQHVKPWLSTYTQLQLLPVQHFNSCFPVLVIV